MAYDGYANPARLVSHGIGDSFQRWAYVSADPITTVRQSGYIDNGGRLGMRVGDLVEVVNTAASPIAVQICIVTAISTAVKGPADLSDGTAVTATNTD